jgi:hypothetical protein
MVVAANHPAHILLVGDYHVTVVAANHPAHILLVGSYHGTVVAANHPALTGWLAATMKWW